MGAHIHTDAFSILAMAFGVFLVAHVMQVGAGCLGKSNNAALSAIGLGVGSFFKT